MYFFQSSYIASLLSLRYEEIQSKLPEQNISSTEPFSGMKYLDGMYLQCYIDYEVYF